MLKKRKILIYSDCMFYGGCENVLTNLLSSEELTSEFQMTFVYRYSEVYEKGFRNAVGKSKAFTCIPVKLPVFDSWIYSAQVNGYNRYLRKIVAYFDSALRLSGLSTLYIAIRLALVLFQIRPDVLHLNNGGYPAALSVRVFAVVAHFLSRTPVVMTVNNLAYPAKGLINRLADILVAKSVRLFITASQAAGRELAIQRKFNKDLILNIPNCTGQPPQEKSLRAELGLSDTKFIFAAAGLLTHRKGFDVLLRATSKVAEKNSNFLLLLFGEGEERASLTALHYELGLGSTVKFMGHRPDFTRQLSEINTLVTPSRANEDMPYVLIEAASIGVPCIGTRIAGIPEVITQGINGYIVEPENIDQLAAAMQSILTNPDLESKFGIAAKGIYEKNHTVSKCVERYRDVYNGLINLGNQVVIFSDDRKRDTMT